MIDGFQLGKNEASLAKPPKDREFITLDCNKILTSANTNDSNISINLCQLHAYKDFLVDRKRDRPDFVTLV